MSISHARHPVAIVQRGPQASPSIRMKRLSLLAAAAALLAAAAPPARAQQSEPRILVTGTVMDSVSGYPLYGVAVATTTTHDHTATDSTGAFTLSVPAGTVMLTFTGRGFQPVAQLLASTGNVELGRVSLLPEAFALAPIEVSVSQLEQRIRQFTGSVRVFPERMLAHAGDSDLFQYLRHRVPLRPVPCNATDNGPMTECFLVRGRPERPQLFINEVRISTLALTEIYRPEDVARVEVFAGGKMIRIYTRGYLEMMSRTSTRPDALPPT